MSLARSTYYYHPKGRRRDEEVLMARIEAICGEFLRYGYRRVTAQLRHEGWHVNHKKVARILRERGLSVKPRRQAVRTSDGGCREAVFPNLACHFIPGGPNELWVGDITCICIRLAFVYLAVILDAWSRRVVGYAVSRQIDTRLTLAALRAAFPNLAGVGGPATTARLHSSYRPRQPIWLGSVPRGAGGLGLARIDEPPRQSV